MAVWDHLLRIVAGYRKAGRCRDCHRPIVWVTTAPKGKRLPFDCEPVVLEREQNPTTLVRFEVISKDHLHFTTCPKRVRKSTTDMTPRDSQPRLL